MVFSIKNVCQYVIYTKQSSIFPGKTGQHPKVQELKTFLKASPTRSVRHLAKRFLYGMEVHLLLIAIKICASVGGEVAWAR